MTPPPSPVGRTPPGTTEEVRAGSALVLAPHHDDEVLGCGGLVAKLSAAGSAVRVLFLSDGGGDAEGEERRTYVERRRAEARAAAKVLGIAGVDELGLPDGGLDQHLEAIAKGLRRALLSLRPELLLVTSPLESSADHRAAFAAVHRLLGGLRKGVELWPIVEGLEILTYEVNHPLHPDVLVDISDYTSRLAEAMARYESQQERHDYLGARLGLARFRTLTLPPEVSHVEAYRRLVLADFTTRSPAQLIAELGGTPPRLEIREGPTMSVIVRTKDRPQLLAQALESLAASTYRRAEVVVVNDGGEPPAIPHDLPLPAKLVSLESNRGRAAAANAGFGAASGDFVVFLDDDDLAFAEHLATLAEMVQAAGVRVAYTDAAVGVYKLGETGWKCIERRLPYSRDFDPELLLVDNYIPFNTVAIDRRLVEEVGEMDADLTFFEDWDYLIRLAERTPFHHLARVTCEYRQFRGGGHHVLGDAPRERADFLAMKARVIAKHAARLTPGAVARVVDRLRGEAVAEGEESARRRGELEGLTARYHRLKGERAAIEAHQQALQVLEERGRAEVDDLRRVEREQAVALGETERQLQRRDRVLGEQEKMLREQGVALEEHRRTLGEQEKMLREQGVALEEHRRTLGEQEKMLREQGEALEEHRRVLDERQGLIDEGKEVIRQREEVIHRQEEVLREQGEALGEHRRALGEQEKMIREQGEALEEHRRVLDERQGLIDEGKEVIREREEVIHRQEEVLREQGEALKEYRRVLGEQGRALEEKAAALSEQEETLGRTLGEIERLNGLIRTMESSRAWRIHQWWQRHKPGGRTPGAPPDGAAGGGTP